MGSPSAPDSRKVKIKTQKKNQRGNRECRVAIGEGVPHLLTISNILLSRRAERLYFQVNMRLRIFGGFPPMSKLIYTTWAKICQALLRRRVLLRAPGITQSIFWFFGTIPHTKEVYGKEWRSKRDSPSNSRCFVQNKETHILWLLWPFFCFIAYSFLCF